jgi:YD repeat-containing protein
MLRRNLLKSLTALIPISFLGKNAIANENPKHKWEKLIKDENENIIRKEFSDGHFIDYTYNELGQKTSRKDSNGFWRKSTYNENGKELTYETSRRYWEKKTYDENNNRLNYENSGGYWTKYTYNNKNQILTFKDSNGRFDAYAYDSHGNQIKVLYPV